jgi:hypothetical protein
MAGLFPQRREPAVAILGADFLERPRAERIKISHPGEAPVARGTILHSIGFRLAARALNSRTEIDPLIDPGQQRPEESESRTQR